MKKFLLSIFVSLFLLPCTLVSAQDPFSDQRQITLFKSTITVEKNTEINIREEITYYFPGYNHGIIREIPTDYKTGGGFKRPTTLTLNDLYYYPKGETALSNTMYERSSKMGYSIFKIGDPETTITGEYTFVIDYTLHNAVNFFDDHDEIYLNITGNGTDVPINKSYAEIKLPGEITEKICFTGMVGSEEKNCDFEEISSNETRVNMKGSLEPYEGLTVALKMPRGSLNDTRKTQLIEIFLANIGILLPVPIFFFVLSLVKAKGKNKKLTIIPNYEAPKDIYPLLAGQIFNNTVNNKHITAEIIKLAIDGHIKIKEEGKNKFILAKDNISKEILEEAPRALYAGIFKTKDEIATKDIDSTFYVTVNNIKSIVNKEVYEKTFFNKQRQKFKGSLIGIGIVALFLTFVSITPLAYIAASAWSIGLGISALITIILGTTVDLKSDLGNKTYYDILGLKMYINTAEKHKIEFHNDPKKFKGVFEKLLPYAIIFGLEKKWAKEFEDLYKQPPSWYEGNFQTFNTYMLTNSISRIGSNVQSKSIAPTNSSGGFSSSHGGSGGSGFSGGSSGGGFGGGGTSSW